MEKNGFNLSTYLWGEQANQSHAGGQADRDRHAGYPQGYVVGRAEIQRDESQPYNAGRVHCKSCNRRRGISSGILVI